MKVITEERLKEILSCRVYPEWVIEGLIRSDLEEFDSIHEENGQLIVDELRPMSDAPKDGTKIIALTYNKYSASEFLIVNYSHDDTFCTEKYLLPEFALIGWLPMPIYRPKDGE